MTLITRALIFLYSYSYCKKSNLNTQKKFVLTLITNPESCFRKCWITVILIAIGGEHRFDWALSGQHRLPFAMYVYSNEHNSAEFLLHFIIFQTLRESVNVYKLGQGFISGYFLATKNDENVLCFIYFNKTVKDNIHNI